MRSLARTWNQIPIRPDRSPIPVPTEISQFPSITTFCRYNGCKLTYLQSSKCDIHWNGPGRSPYRKTSSQKRLFITQDGSGDMRQLCG